MPMLERAASVASEDPTLGAIEAIRAALSAVVAEDLAAQAEPLDDVDHDPVGETEPVTWAPAGPFGHGKIRLHGRP